MNQVLIEKIKQDLRTLRLKDMAEALEASLNKAHKENKAPSSSSPNWCKYNLRRSKNVHWSSG